MTLSEFRSAVRRMTRMFSTATVSDEIINSFINEAVRSIAFIPFNIKRHSLSTQRRVSVYPITDALINVISVLYYPENGSFLSNGITDTQTDIQVQNPSVFTGRQYAQIGYPPNYEIIGIANGLGNVTRGQQNTGAQAWSAGTPIRVWSAGVRWVPLTGQNVYTSLQSVLDTGSDAEPTRYTWSNNSIILDKPPRWVGAHNILVYGHTRPAALVNDADTVEGLPLQFSNVVVYRTLMDLLLSFGGEGMQKADLYFRLYQDAVEKLNEWAIAQFGNTGFVPNIGRQPFGITPQR